MLKMRYGFYTILWTLGITFLVERPVVVGAAIAEELPFTERSVFSQIRTVSGVVTDIQQGMLLGVTVSVKGANVSASTGVDGAYKIDVPVGHDTLVFSSVGYLPQEVVIVGRSTVDVILELESSGLDEVV